jgi:acyl-CoA reductase-like NAD-dependent aldehyde dehydrogenase
MPKPFSKIRSAAIDGRLHNPIYRKIQLKSLHDTLSKSLGELQRIIARDTGHGPAEVKLECWLALRCISEAYTAIDPAKALEDEYAIASRRDADDAREPVGIIVIEPATYTFFYSLVSALVPALAAGNCVLIQVTISHALGTKFIPRIN